MVGTAQFLQEVSTRRENFVVKIIIALYHRGVDRHSATIERNDSILSVYSLNYSQLSPNCINRRIGCAKMEGLMFELMTKLIALMTKVHAPTKERLGRLVTRIYRYYAL